MRIQMALLLVLAMFLLALPVAAAATPAASAKRIKIGYEYNYGTIMEPATGGNVGYGYDYLTEIAKYTGWEYEFIKCNWNDGLRMLSSGEIDLLGPMQKSAQRETMYEFPTRAMGYEYGALYAHADSKVPFGDLDYFDGMRVGVRPGNHYNDVLEKLCKEKDISVELVYTNRDNGGIAKELKYGVYDLFLAGSLSSIPQTKLVSKISTESFYYASTKGNTEITAQLDSAIEKILGNDMYFEWRLDSKYHANKTIGAPDFTPAELEAIASHPKFTVCCEKNASPMQFFNSLTGEMNGISIEILNSISAISGIKFEYVPHISGHETAQLSIGHHRSSHHENVDYTESYLSVPLTLVSTHEWSTIPDLRVGTYSFPPAEVEAAERFFPSYTMINYETPSEMLKATKNGKIDAMLLSLYSLEDLKRANKSTTFVSKPIPLSFHMEIGVSELIPPEIFSVLNKSIKNMSAEEINSAVFRNTSAQREQNTLIENVRNNAYTIIAIISAFGVIIVFFVWDRNLKLKKVINIDDITGLPSFTRFKADAASILQNAKPNEYMAISVDIENFKYINDAFDYTTGDELLKTLATYFYSKKTHDTIFARVFADNFVFITQNRYHGEASIANYINDSKIATAIKELLGNNYRISFSLGVFTIDDPKKDLSLILDCANIARKSVKGRHNNPMAVYTEAMSNEMANKKDITMRMEAALESREFVPYLQPKYSLADNKLIGAEALVRWVRPDGSILQPMMFIPLFEKNGFIQKLDMYMFERVCQMLFSWKSKGCRDVPRISVNLSKYSLQSDSLLDDLMAIINQYDIKSDDMEIELTESTAVDNVDRMLVVMSGLKREGFFVSIDDFGSGYSSLNVLKDMPADVVKIDKVFLSSSHNSEKGKLVLNNVIRMSRELNMETVAEGVETQEQADNLRNMGCDVAQGYLFAKPMPVPEFEALWLENEIKRCQVTPL